MIVHARSLQATKAGLELVPVSPGIDHHRRTESRHLASEQKRFDAGVIGWWWAHGIAKALTREPAFTIP